MSAEQCVSVLVLSTQNWSNSSQIVRLLSEEHGSQSVIARGSRRFSADFRYGPLDVLQWGTARVLAQPRGLRLLGFEASGSFAGLSAEQPRLLSAFMLLEILSSGTCAGPQPGVLKLALESLAVLEHGPLPGLDAVLQRFELHFLMLSGRAPEWDACVQCRRPAPAGKPARLDPWRGGLLCRGCVRGNGEHLIALSAPAREALRLLSVCTDPRQAEAIVQQPAVRRTLGHLLRLLTGFSLERPLPSWNAAAV